VSIHDRQICYTVAVILDCPIQSAGDTVTTQHLENDVLCRHPCRQSPGQLHAPHFRHAQADSSARHGRRHVGAASGKGQHAERPRGTRVAVRADETRARDPESLHVHGMADAVARRAVPDAVAVARTAQKRVIVSVLVILLQEVVVDILNRTVDPNAIEVERLQQQHHQCSGRILRQRLIDREPYLLAGAGRLVGVQPMLVDQLFRERTGTHALLSWLCSTTGTDAHRLRRCRPRRFVYIRHLALQAGSAAGHGPLQEPGGVHLRRPRRCSTPMRCTNRTGVERSLHRPQTNSSGIQALGER
jgi:hypothetical protein